jgi:hypothetical protein
LRLLRTNGQITRREERMSKPVPPSILDNKHYGEASAFAPENLLREARRQKGLNDGENLIKAMSAGTKSPSVLHRTTRMLGKPTFRGRAQWWRAMPTAQA